MRNCKDLFKVQFGFLR